MDATTGSEHTAASANPWSGELTRGVLPLLVLRTLRDAPSYGYAIGATLAHRGIRGVKGNVLYPLLARQEVAGHVETEWRPGDGGPGRRYFSLTPEGEAEVERLRAGWRSFVAATERIITDDGTAS